MVHLIHQHVPKERTNRCKNNLVGPDPLIILAHKGDIAEIIVSHFDSGCCCKVLKLIQLQHVCALTLVLFPSQVKCHDCLDLEVLATAGTALPPPPGSGLCPGRSQDRDEGDQEDPGGPGSASGGGDDDDDDCDYDDDDD